MAWYFVKHRGNFTFTVPLPKWAPLYSRYKRIAAIHSTYSQSEIVCPSISLSNRQVESDLKQKGQILRCSVFHVMNTFFFCMMVSF